MVGVSSAGGAAAGVKEARPPDQGGSSGDHQQTLQGLGVVGREGGAVRSCWRDVADAGDAGTGPGVGQVDAPAVLPESQRAAP